MRALTLLARPDAARVLVTLPRDRSTRRRAALIRDRYDARQFNNERKRMIRENLKAIQGMWTEIPEAVQAAQSFTFLDPAEISPQDRIEPRSLMHDPTAEFYRVTEERQRALPPEPTLWQRIRQMRKRA